MAFRVGQKVVCVDAKGRRHLGFDWIHSDAPVEGVVYTVAGLTFEQGEPCIVLAERPRSEESEYEGYAARRSRPVVERKTDISIFEKMLTSQGVDA